MVRCRVSNAAVTWRRRAKITTVYLLNVCMRLRFPVYCCRNCCKIASLRCWECKITHRRSCSVYCIATIRGPSWVELLVMPFSPEWLSIHHRQNTLQLLPISASAKFGYRYPDEGLWQMRRETQLGAMPTERQHLHQVPSAIFSVRFAVAPDQRLHRCSPRTTDACLRQETNENDKLPRLVMPCLSEIGQPGLWHMRQRAFCFLRLLATDVLPQFVRERRFLSHMPINSYPSAKTVDYHASKSRELCAAGCECLMCSAQHLRTILTHFWAGVSHVRVYACLRNAYRLTSHGQGAWRNRKALCAVLIDPRHAWIKSPILFTYRPKSERSLF